MAKIFLLPEIDKIIFKLLDIRDLINLLLTNKNNKKIIELTKKYFKPKQFYIYDYDKIKSCKNDRFFTANIYQKYFCVACCYGEKYTIKYLSQKYIFSDQYYWWIYINFLLETGNLKIIEWFHNKYISKIYSNNLQTYNLGNYKLNIIKFLIKQYNLDIKIIIGDDIYRAVITKNLDFLNYFYDKINKECLSRTIFFDSNYELINWFLNTYDLDIDDLKKQRSDYNTSMIALNLIDKKLNISQDYNLEQKILLNSIYICKTNSQDNYSELSYLLSPQIESHLKVRLIFMALTRNNFKFLNLICSKLNIRKYMIISNLYACDDPILLDYLVCKYNLKFEEIIIAFSKNNLELIKKYYIKFGMPISFKISKFICQFGDLELFKLLIENNKINFLKIIKDDFQNIIFEFINSEKLLLYLLESNIINLDKYYPFSKTIFDNTCYFIQSSLMDLDIFEYIKKNNFNFEKLDMNIIFIKSCEKSLEFAKFIYNNFNIAIIADNNIKIWLS